MKKKSATASILTSFFSCVCCLPACLCLSHPAYCLLPFCHLSEYLQPYLFIYLSTLPPFILGPSGGMSESRVSGRRSFGKSGIRCLSQGHVCRGNSCSDETQCFTIDTQVASDQGPDLFFNTLSILTIILSAQDHI